MYVNFEYYRIFYYVAQYENFTKAAQALGSNQPNVTRAMNRLEAEIHCKLFARSNRGVHLTPEGESLYRHVKAAMFQFEEAERELTAAVSLDEGSVSVGASETALHVYLLEVLEQFRMRHPGIRLCISNHSTPQAIKAVQDGAVDFAVVTTPLALPTGMQAVPLVPFDEILVGGRTFAALATHPLALPALKKYPLIALGPDTMTSAYYRALFARYGLEFEPDTEVATADQLLPLVRHELGLAFVPAPLAQEALERGEVIRLALTEPLPQREICFVHDPLHPLGTAARKLKKLILNKSET